MAAGFRDLSKAQQLAVAAYVNREFDRVISGNPSSYIAQNALSNPDEWRERLRDLLATDEKRVSTIMDAALKKTQDLEGAFTLIELSIVLVIIGLIVGGVLVGQDLIRAAAVRAQISQIERFNTATNTFRDKYDALPGDINASAAAQFGFSPRGSLAGQGDGNGVIEGNANNSYGGNNGESQNGESTMFWADLSAAHLIEGSFTTATATTSSSGSPALYMPAAKIGGTNYICVWSGGPMANGGKSDGQNYFCLISANNIYAPNSSLINSLPGLSVQQAYSIDKKIDDGFPQTGNVLAMYVNNEAGYWGIWAGAASGSNGSTTTATPGSSSTCYDNGNTDGAIQQYSLTQSNGLNVNCGLSFQFE